MPTVPQPDLLRKENLSNSTKVVLSAALDLLRRYPKGLIYPANSSTKVPLFKQYNSRRVLPSELETWLPQFPRIVPAIIPASFGLLGIDGDDGDPDELKAALAENKIDFLAVNSARSWHVYVRCRLAASRIPAKWSAFGAGGDLRYRTNILLYGDTVQRLVDFLGRRRQAMSGAFRDELVVQQDQVAAGRAYDSATLAHGRTVYMAGLKQADVPGWAGAVAQLEGVKPEAIRQNELKSLAAASERMDWAEDIAADVHYRGRIRDTYVAMLALATGGTCWASHRTISLVAGIPDNDRKTVRRHQERLERDGLIERASEQGLSWRGSPSVVWKLNVCSQTDPQ